VSSSSSSSPDKMDVQTSWVSVANVSFADMLHAVEQKSLPERREPAQSAPAAPASEPHARIHLQTRGCPSMHAFQGHMQAGNGGTPHSGYLPLCRSGGVSLPEEPHVRDGGGELHVDAAAPGPSGRAWAAPIGVIPCQEEGACMYLRRSSCRGG
jgi:hypothetical protein